MNPVITVLLILFVCFAVVGILWIAVDSLVNAAREEKKPLVEQRATVIAKRQEVSGGVGSSGVNTSYYATFELEAGDRMELPIQGTDYGLMVEGDTGTLSSKGNNFKGFQRQQLKAY